jgi:glutathione synthase/RimK-type ligase-like ATP-grasp enzyme
MEKCDTKIAVGKDRWGWYEKFAAALEEEKKLGYNFDYQVVNLDNHDWIKTVTPFDMVIWNPSFMGVRIASHFKEKIYFMESMLGKMVIPNYNTIWHFESKIAQSYIFSSFGVPTPETIVSFDLNDSINLINQSNMPLVYKKPFGAGSKNVTLWINKENAKNEINKLFSQELWERNKIKTTSKIAGILKNIFQPWFWEKIRKNIFDEERYGMVYWQKYIPDNRADLRIAIIGNQFAFGFWRNNRPGDFRASGSGLIDFDRTIPEDVLQYCFDLSTRLNFDSMGYDVIFENDHFVITEMSYNYIDFIPHKSKGYYQRDANKAITFHAGHTWPEELWVKWLLKRGNLIPDQKV